MKGIYSYSEEKFKKAQQKFGPAQLYSYGIACRDEDLEISGLFVNTDPKSSSFNREAAFQAEKLRCYVNDNLATNSVAALETVNNYRSGEGQFLFRSIGDVISHLENCKGSDASKFTRDSGLQRLISRNWLQDKLGVMYQVQQDFILLGGQRGLEYAYTLLALKNLGIGVIESSRSDPFWAVMETHVGNGGQGGNDLGTIHAMIADDLEDALKNGIEIRPGIKLKRELVAQKADAIRTRINNNQHIIMEIFGMDSVSVKAAHMAKATEAHGIIVGQAITNPRGMFGEEAYRSRCCNKYLCSTAVIALGVAIMPIYSVPLGTTLLLGGFAGLVHSSHQQEFLLQF